MMLLYRWGEDLPPILLLIAAPLARPNVLGETYSAIAMILALAAAMLALLTRNATPWTTGPPRRQLWWLVGCLVFASTWVVARAISALDQDRVLLEVRGAAITIITVAAAVIVIGDERFRLIVVKGLVGLLVALCISYAITAGIWMLVGAQAGLIGSIPVGNVGLQPFYAPFTATASKLSVFGLPAIPRFTGLGREPGWMAMYASLAFFLAPRVGWHQWWIRMALALGVIGTLSTGGFAVFTLVLVYDLLFRPRMRLGMLATYLMKVLGSCAMLAAGWLIVIAPALGLDAKQTVNRSSLLERNEATQAGWDALANSPIVGGDPARAVGGVNLVAAIAAYGFPFVAMTVAALLVPRINHPAPALTTAPVAVLLLTLATSQPPAGSTWVYVVAAVAYACCFSTSVKEPRLDD